MVIGDLWACRSKAFAEVFVNPGNGSTELEKGWQKYVNHMAIFQ